MKFSIAIMTSVLATSLLVSAAPFQRRAGTGTTKKMATTRLDASGAVYCMWPRPSPIHSLAYRFRFAVLTNEPDENQIIAASINADGTLVGTIFRARLDRYSSPPKNLDRAVAAGGRGSHGKSSGPDALFSQGSIKVSKKGKVLAAVNVSD